MRLYLLYLFVLVLIVYTRRNWFVSLCGLMLLTATINHSDMPRNLMGIYGMNFWNFVFLFIVVAWVRQLRHEKQPWEFPRWARRVGLWYLAITIVAFLQIAADLKSSSQGWTHRPMECFTEFCLNTVKFAFPVLLWFDAARTRRHVIIALVFILLIPLYVSYKVYKTAPMSNLTTTTVNMQARWRIGKAVGFHANSAAYCCVAGFWGAIAFSSARKRYWQMVPILGASVLMALGVGLCQSRAGYITFIGTGLLFAVFLYRHLLVLFPIGLLIIPTYFPGITARLFYGVDEETASGETANDMGKISAGRSGEFWIYVIDDIWTNPLIGYGREAILRRPCRDKIIEHQGICPEHPHNAYLQMLHEAGVVGLLSAMSVFGLGLVLSIRLCLDRRDALFRAVGGVGLACTAALLIMGYSGNSFWPKDNNQIAWCVLGILLRVWVERAKMPGSSREPGQRGSGMFSEMAAPIASGRPAVW